MNKRLFLFFLSIPLFSSAEVVTVKGEAYDLFISRPVDIWSPDPSHRQVTLGAIKDKNASYMLMGENGKSQFRGSPLTFQGISDHPVTQGVKEKASSYGLNLINGSGYYFNVSAPLEVKPSEFSMFLDGQSKIYRKFVVAQGDPAQLESSAATKKLIGGALAIAGTFYATDKLGGVFGANAAFNSTATNLSGDVYGFFSKIKGVVAPVEFLEPIDASKYSGFEVRKVTSFPEMIGQIVIAYKGEKKADVQNEALIQSIIELTGATTNTQSVEAARQKDFERRLAIWKEENERK